MFYYLIYNFIIIICLKWYIYVKTGYLNKSARFGYTPKMLYAGFFGYIFGNFSYIGECRKRVKRVQDNQIIEDSQKEMLVFI